MGKKLRNSKTAWVNIIVFAIMGIAKLIGVDIDESIGVEIAGMVITLMNIVLRVVSKKEIVGV